MLAAYSTSAEMLIAARALLGIAGATLGPSTLALTSVVLSLATILPVGYGLFGGALGIGILGSVGTAVYRGQVADAIPAAVPAQAAEATRDTLGGATVAADQLPAGLAVKLLGPAREAFTHGPNAAAGFSAATLAVLAVLAMALLQHLDLDAAGTEDVDSTRHRGDRGRGRRRGRRGLFGRRGPGRAGAQAAPPDESHDWRHSPSPASSDGCATTDIASRLTATQP